jgi:hypothetical protein
MYSKFDGRLSPFRKAVTLVHLPPPAAADRRMEEHVLRRKFDNGETL